ncbi:subtilisin-like protease SBT2.4 [Punica granatum]|uniref:Subtilisin-like protease SBT2.4 n=2 Tax=Punica granatum TaxID=22663 RepID=A0A6P8DX04_PUNGR|nr:subtilisin-like protease SBT2.4 [Punica granatum]
MTIMAKISQEHLAIITFLILLAISVVVASIETIEKRGIYLVLMEGEPVAFHGGSTNCRQARECLHRPQMNREMSRACAEKLVKSHDQLLQNTLRNGTYDKLYSFKHVVNGFAVHATLSEAKKLKKALGVKLMERDRGAEMMTTYTPEFLGLPEGLWKQQGGGRTAGEGIVIGFVDTGINPLHPSFSARQSNGVSCGPANASRFLGKCETGPQFPATSCNGKIASARFFSAGAQAVAPLNRSVDFLSPFDAVGHGSHVASIAAGNADVPVVVNGFLYGLSSGMAPAARIAVYKAMFPTIGTLTDVIAAIDQAIYDGVDILTLSVGPVQPPQSTLTVLGMFDIVMLFARRAGVFVVQAAGNSGPSPSSVISYSPWVVGAAASSTDRTYTGSLLLGNGTRVGGVGLSGPTLGSGLFMYRLVLAQDAVKRNGTFPRTPPYTEECQYPEAFDPLIVQGSVVICTFSSGFINQTSSVSAILSTARDLHFTGFVLVANPKYGDFIVEPIPFPVPGIMIPNVSDVKVILQYYQRQTSRDRAGAVTNFRARAAIGEGRAAAFTRRAPTVSRFSSRGPDFIDVYKNLIDVLKPDILAPGRQVWAAWSPMSVSEQLLRGHSFALLSGTSMATPHVAGIAALIKQSRPTWTPSMIASAMSTTAIKHDNFGNIIMSEGFDFSLTTSTPFAIGSGHINPTGAIDPGLVFYSEYEDYIGFLCSIPGIRPSVVQAATGEPCTRTLAHPSDLNLPSVTISALNKSRTVQRSIKNVGTVQETYLGSVLPPNGTTISLNPTWFTVNPGETRDFDIEVNVTRAMSTFSFGEIVWTGSLNHIVRIPLTIRTVSV